MYTPKAKNFVYQGSRDWGIHDFNYAIYPHVDGWEYAGTPWLGFFVKRHSLASKQETRWPLRERVLNG
jgi:hypothetical protein